MPGTYGNDQLYRPDFSAYIDYAGASENVTLPVGTIAVTLYATTKCWIAIGDPGETPVAAAPGAEKTFVKSIFPLNADVFIDVPVPPSTDGALVKIAVIQSSSGGTLDIITRKE
jgi:hypothetical protein